MGQTLRRILEWSEEDDDDEEEAQISSSQRRGTVGGSNEISSSSSSSSAVAVAGRILRKHRRDLEICPNLTDLPPELSLQVLSHLNATDLCLAACVWQQLASDEILWSGLCRSTWQYASIYSAMRRRRHNSSDDVDDDEDDDHGSYDHDKDGDVIMRDLGEEEEEEEVDVSRTISYRRLFLLLDEASLTFNADPDRGIEYLVKNQLVADEAEEIARFFNGTSKLHKHQQKLYLEKRHDVLQHLVQLQDFNGFLPNRLREFFKRTCHAPNARNEYLTILIDQFSKRFTTCNSNLGLNKDTIFILCYSLIMLSVDLGSPHVKNKMSKREFIRNLRHAAPDVNDEYTGHLYDNVYLIGHVIPQPVTS